MATPKTATAATVDIFVPKGNGKDEPNLLICVNGENFLLPKGKTSTVPVHIAEEFYRSQRAAATQDENREQLLEAAK